VGWVNAGVSYASLFEIDPDIRPTLDCCLVWWLRQWRSVWIGIKSIARYALWTGFAALFCIVIAAFF
jgi:hypothetical protein